MDPKVPFLLLGIAVSTKHDAKVATVDSLTPPASPIYEWPERREPIEGDHPAHGEGSDESPMFVGMTSNIAISNTASVTVDSGASGYGPYGTAHWLSNDLNLVTSVEELDAYPYTPPVPRSEFWNYEPDPTKHNRNRSTIKARRAFTRRRG
jgi:hypothetical protein